MNKDDQAAIINQIIERMESIERKLARLDRELQEDDQMSKDSKEIMNLLDQLKDE
jgi:hypothetical protein